MTDFSLSLSSSEIVTGKTPSRIQGRLRGGTALCLFRPGSSHGGAVLIPSEKPELAEACLQKLLQALDEAEGPSSQPWQAKLVGSGKTFQNLLFALERKTIPVIGSYSSPSFSLEISFETATGKIRILKNPTSQDKSSDGKKKKRVLIVDDSKTIRDMLSKIINEDPELEVVGSVGSPSEAMSAIRNLNPDVITLDLILPEMDGAALLKQFFPLHPIPTVMISSLSQNESPLIFQALEFGAVDFIQKATLTKMKESASLIREKIRAAASSAPVKPHQPSQNTFSFPLIPLDTSVLIAIGASTGGTEAIKQLIRQLPPVIPPIVITQHIPAVFSKSFADHLQTFVPFEVKEASHGEEVHPGKVLIAAGGKHLRIRKRGEKLFALVSEDAPVNKFRPSVDVLFASVAEHLRDKAIGILLTGMGTDGARGLLQIRQAGGRTIAQDRESCVVFGMPREAIEMGAAEKVCALDKIPESLREWIGISKAA